MNAAVMKITRGMKCFFPPVHANLKHVCAALSFALA